MHNQGIDYRELIDSLGLQAKVKKGAGFAKQGLLKKKLAHDEEKKL